MGIERQTQYYIKCDVCDDYYEAYGGSRESAISIFRENGWKIGKKCVCQDCSEVKNG